MRITGYLLILILFLNSCSFLSSGSRGSLSGAVDKSQSEDAEERKVGHDYDVDEEYHHDEDPYFAGGYHHLDIEDDSTVDTMSFDYSSTASKPQYKSGTRDSLIMLDTKSDTFMVDSSQIVSLKGIDLGLDKAQLSQKSVQKSATSKVTITPHEEQKATATVTVTKEDNKSKEKESDRNVAFGCEFDPQLLLSRNFSRAVGGNIYVGGALDNKRKLGGRREYMWGKLGFHQYHIGSEDSLYNRFKYNDLFSFNAGLEYMRYLGVLDNPIASPYIVANGGFEVLNWDYKNALIDSVSNEEVDNDALVSFNAGAGGGVTLLNSSPVRVGANVTAGVRFYSLSTTEEFDNDLFKPELYIKGALRLWIDLGFKKNRKRRN